MNRPEDTMETNAGCCLICGAEAAGKWEPRLRLATADVRVVSCPNCGFTWRTDAGARAGSTCPLARREPAAFGCLTASPEAGIEEMEEIRLFFDSPGSLLNVGNDSSDIIETARIYGWKSQTVAAIEEAEVYAEPVSAYPRDVRPQSRRGTFHVVRLEDALENAPDPGDYLHKIAAYLDGKGLLIVNAVDFSRWDFALFGEGSPNLPGSIPRWFFTPRILQTLLEKSGFRVLKITPYRVPQIGFPLEPAVDARFPQSASGRSALDFTAENAPFVSRFRIIAQSAQRASRRGHLAWNYHPQSESHAPRFEPAPA
jgi:hypothetical protein